MKRFYSILFLGAALLSGSVYGMEKAKMVIVKFEDHPGIMQRVHDTNLMDGLDFETLQKNLDNLNIIMQSVTDKNLNTEKATIDEIDTLLVWLCVFDGTNHEYEALIADALGLAITTHGLATQMRPWEHSLLQKGNELQGLGKRFIDALREKDQTSKNMREQLRAKAENRKDQIVAQIFKCLLMREDIKLDALLHDELIGEDAPLAGHLDYINKQIITRIQKSKAIKNGQALLDIWNAKFRLIQEQRELEDEQFWQEFIQDGERQAVEQRQQEHQVAEQRRQAEEQERQRIAKWHEEEEHQAEERRQRQIEEQLKNRDEQQRQYEEQKSRQREVKQRRQVEEQTDKSSLEDLLNKANAGIKAKPKVALPQQPDIAGPEVDNSKGAAALLMSLGAPKLAVIAIVAVGLCYLGYTKYKAHKTAQAKETKDQEENNDQNAHDKQQNVRNKKQSIHSKQHVR